MHLESLQVFCDVARLRSFSLAAETNGLTQSAVSQIVSQLEKRLRAPLVDRSTRPLQLTGPGQQFHEGCKAILAQYQELEASVRSTQAEVAGNVTVAAIYSVGLGDLSEQVDRFQSDLPNARVHVDYLHPDRVYERVLEGTADIGLVSFPRTSSKLAALPWREEPMVLTTTPGHPLGRKATVKVARLAGERYVHFDRHLMIRKYVDRFLREREVTVDVVAEFDNIENIKQAVAEGAGVALLPEPTLRRELKARTLKAMPLAGASLHRPLGIIYRRRTELSAVTRRFVELLRRRPPVNPKARS